jgi:hypothetical protein
MIKMDLVSDVHHMYLVNITAIYNVNNATTGGDVSRREINKMAEIY